MENGNGVGAINKMREERRRIHSLNKKIFALHTSFLFSILIWLVFMYNFTTSVPDISTINQPFSITIMYYSLLSYPLIIALSIMLSVILHQKNKNKAALYVANLPLVLILLFLFSYVAFIS